MNNAYLLIGGNIGDREKNLADARKLINAQCGDITVASAIYETAAWGKTDQSPFLNQALLVQTDLPPQQLLQQLLKIEKNIGRTRKEKYGPRIIDIDILFFNDEIIDDAQLTIPHPEIQNRRFVLAPMAEIGSSYTHPVFQQTIDELLSVCPDHLAVTRYNALQ